MSFSGFGFLFGFLPVALAGFWAASRFGPMAGAAWLLLCSLAFYGWADPVLAVGLAVSIEVHLAFGRAISATEARPRRQTAILAAGILLNLASIGFARLLPAPPPGISFIAFTQIGYLLDQRGAPAGGRLSDALLIGFFPHLLAGPILRGWDVAGQFGAVRRGGSGLAIGSLYLLIGLLKKTLLADPLGSVVAAGFGDAGGLTLAAAWQAALAWSFQLYFDFSGYSDMAVGLGRLFGVRLPHNFDSPYKARSVIEYWQRWHITLTRFLMSTIHTPLTLAIMRRRRASGLAVDRAAQRGPAGFGAMILAPIAITMVLAGVWHGWRAPFLVFGLLHAGFLVLNHAWRLWRGGAPAGGRPTDVALTYLCVLVGAVVFRAPDLGTAGGVLAGMAGLHGLGPALPDARTLLDVVWLAGLAAIIWLLPNSREIMEGQGGWLRWRPSPGWAVAAGCAATLGVLSMGGTNEFVYFQF